MALTYRTLAATATKTGAARQFKFVISNKDVDRMGDTIDPAGWDLTAYKTNPVILWQHQTDCPPIAKSVSIGIERGNLVSVAQFPPQGLYPFADQIHDLIAGEFINCASVGFKPLKQKPNGSGYDFTAQALHEWSVVSIPALPSATVQRRLEGVDPAGLRKFLGGASEADIDIDIEIEDGSSELLDLDIEDGNEIDVEDIAQALVAAFPGAMRSAVGDLVRVETEKALGRARGRVFDDPITGDPAARRHHVGQDIDATKEDVTRAMRDVVGAAVGEFVRGEFENTVRRLRGAV